MKEIINERLKKISAYILENEKIIDIGCDHALLDIYLCQNKHLLKIIASDINEKPLLKAKENILKYHLEDKIIIKCADGLTGIENDINTIVISGMGTTNIIKILANISDYPDVNKLVLSPNNDFELLRKEITKLGFRIVKEEMVKDNNKYYLICEFEKGNELVDYYFGKLDLKNITNNEYFLNVYKKNQIIINRINSKRSLRKKELLKENQIIKEKIHLK